MTEMLQVEQTKARYQQLIDVLVGWLTTAVEDDQWSTSDLRAQLATELRPFTNGEV